MRFPVVLALSTIFAPGSTRAASTRDIGTQNSTLTAPISGSSSLSSSYTSTSSPSITAAPSNDPDAAARLSTSYFTRWRDGEWNPYGTVGYTSSTLDAYTLKAPKTTLPVGEVVYVYNDFRFNYTPSAPCCLNCTLFGGTVQVYDWPTPAPSPQATKLVNSDNFTFVSPSVYVAFQSLYATDLCGTVGDSYSSTTLAFAPGQLMTAPEYFIGTPYYVPVASNQSTLVTPTFVPPNESFTVASFGAESGCSDMTTVTKFSDQLLSFDPGMGGDGTETVTMTWNPCFPKVSVPTELFTINPSWTACLAGIDGFFDPPYILTPGSGLSAFSPTAVPVEATLQPQTTRAASAGSTPLPITPAHTTAGPSTVIEENPQATFVPPELAASSTNPADSSGPTLPVNIASELLMDSSIQYLVGSQTLIPGEMTTVTISGSAVGLSLLAGGSGIVVGGSLTLAATALILGKATITQVFVTETGLGGDIATLGGFVGPGSSATSLVTPSSNVAAPGETTSGAIDGTTQSSDGASRWERQTSMWDPWLVLIVYFGTIGVLIC